MRFHLFEFEDFSWFPNTIREGGTDFLRYFLNATHFYSPVVPLISQALQQTRENRIVDLCSGGGGNIEQVCEALNKKQTVSVTLTDKFPNLNAFKYIHQSSNGAVGFEAQPVDATQVQKEIKGMRTMFSAVHHFSPSAIKAILADAAKNNCAIGLFDGGDKNIFTLLGIILFHPIAFAVCTPFFRPFRFSRLLFTYVLPLIPLTTVWDGCVSILRLYSPEELMALAKQSDNNFIWQAGKVKNKLGMHVTYLIGYPATKHSQ